MRIGQYRAGTPMKSQVSDSDERRTRSHARALAGRVHLTGDKVLLVRGRPAAERLINCLTNSTAIPDTCPTPTDLGFAASDVTPIARGSLGTRSRSVQRWRAGVDREAAGRLTPTRRRELAEQVAELDGLSARVADLHRLFADPPADPAPFWLSVPDEESLRATFTRLVADRVVTAEVAWLARLVFWVGGQPAAERFLTTVRDGLCFPNEVAAREAVLRFRAILMPVVKRLDVLNELPREQQAAALVVCREKSREENVAARLRRAFDELPDSARGPNRIVLPTRRSEIDVYLLRDRCDVVLKEYQSPPEWAKLTRLAALYLTDNGSTALTWPAADHVDHSWTVRILAEESTKPGYESLLAHLGSLTFDGPSLDRVRRLFAAGFDVECVNWWGHHLNERLDDEADLRALPAVREVVTWLTGRDPALDEYVLAFWESASAPGGRPVAESLARFVRWLAAPTAQQVGEVAGLVRLLSLPAFRQRLVERLRRWGDPPPRTRLPADCPDGLPADLVALLRRLAFHQAMAGEAVRLPKSLRKPLDAAARTERELAYLRGLGDGRDGRQAARLRHLEARAAAGAEDGVSAGRLVRQAREVAAVTALIAAKTVLRDELTAWWRGRFDCDPGLDSFGWRHLHQLMTWADGLSDADRRLVDAVMAAFRDHGPLYRRHLPHNAGWLAHAAAAIDVAAWLAPPPVRRTLADGMVVTVRPAADPREVFLMGSRFGTCLSLDRGENKNAVLPNAADANKAVLYAYSPDGEPLARMLVGVAAGWRLIGFPVYESRGDVDDGEMVRVFGEYCGAWAARAGLTLADDGDLPTLTGGFWYDDRARPWCDATKAAYQAAGGRTTSAPPPAAPSADSTAAVVWQIVRAPHESVRSWEGVEYDVLFHHLAARGLIPSATDPRTWGPGATATTQYRGERVRVRDRLYGEMIWALPWLLPPDAGALRAGVNLLASIEYEPGNAHTVCFATCPPTPLLGTLPLATVVQLLRRYADWFRVPNCGCQQDSRPEWAGVLHAAWRRDRDTRLMVLAASDPRELVRDVLRLVYQIDPIPELGHALRRRLKAAARPEGEAIRITLGVQPAPADPYARTVARRDPLVDLAVDRRRSFRERCAAVERLFGGPNGVVDRAVGGELCVCWTAAEREQLSPAIRAGLAKSLASDIMNDSNWCLWPALYWVATLPVEEQPDCFVVEEADDRGVPTRRLWHGYRRLWEHLEWGNSVPPHLAILVQALAHPSAGLGQAVRSLYRAAAQVDPDWLSRMLALTARFVDPETYAAVAAECERPTADTPSNARRSQD